MRKCIYYDSHSIREWKNMEFLLKVGFSQGYIFFAHNPPSLKIKFFFCLVGKVGVRGRGVFRGGAIGAKPLPWTSEIYWFQGFFMPQRVLNPPLEKTKFKPPLDKLLNMPLVRGFNSRMGKYIFGPKLIKAQLS